MVAITYIDFSGTEHSVEAESGQSVMQAAVDNGVPGIDADCGGGCACATCHVMVSNGWRGKLEEPNAVEDSMLGMVPERHEGSRLSCQITVEDTLDGLVVQLPEFQM